MRPVPGFRKAAWRDAIRPAPEPSLEGSRLLGPRGVAADRIEVATTPMHRARGLLGRKALEPGTALLLTPCRQVHTVAMRFSIDVVFCDADLTVVAAETLRPGRMSRTYRRAWCCFELPDGTAARCGIERGVRLQLEPSEGDEHTGSDE